jgi:serine protease
MKQKLLSVAVVLAAAGAVASFAASAQIARGGTTPAPAPAPAAETPATTPELQGRVVLNTGDNTSFGRFIVNYKDGSATRNNGAAIASKANSALTNAGLSTSAKPINATYMRKLATGHDLIRTSRMLDKVEAEAFMRQIATDPNVESVRFDVMRHIVRDTTVVPAFVPNDGAFYTAYNWHYKTPNGTATPYTNTTTGTGPLYGGIDATGAWDYADGHGIVIAVVDTGITLHPDIDTSLADAGYDFISDGYISGRGLNDDRAPGGWDLGDWTTGNIPGSSPVQSYRSFCQIPGTGNTNLSPSSWHGTNTASVAGAEITNNAGGMAGIAYGAKILPVRVLGHCGGYDSDINDGMVWAAGGHIDGVPDNTHPAQIISMSLGENAPRVCPADDPTSVAIAMAKELGAIVVVAAGNNNALANYPPGNCPGVITVASTGFTGKRSANYSNYGPNITIAAPGGGIYVNDAASGTQANPGGFVWSAMNLGTTTPTVSTMAASYSGMAGTSQATPHVSGTIALMQSARLDAGKELLTQEEAVEIMQATVTPLQPGSTQSIGPGIVNAKNAVLAAIAYDRPTPESTELTNSVVVTASSTGDDLYSFVAVAGKPLTFVTSGGTGNVDMYVRFNKDPSPTKFDASSVHAGNTESVIIKTPQAGTYYIRLTGTFSGVKLQAKQ